MPPAPHTGDQVTHFSRCVPFDVTLVPKGYTLKKIKSCAPLADVEGQFGTCRAENTNPVPTQSSDVTIRDHQCRHSRHSHQNST